MIAMDVIQRNEAFISQAIATLRDLRVDPTEPCVNPNGGVVALRHPLGVSGTRIVMSAVEELQHTGSRYALRIHVHWHGSGHRPDRRACVKRPVQLFGKLRLASLVYLA